jgi:ribosomal protein L37AE/L43A
VNRVSVNQCAQCGADIIAAERSEHLSESCVRNVWACDACGYQFEDTVYLSAREVADATL